MKVWLEEEKEYSTELQREGYEKIMCYGISFFQK